MASGGRAPRSRTTRVAASRSSAGSTASRYGSPPRSGVAVEAMKTAMAFMSGAITFVGGIGPVPLLTRTAAWGQERRECSPRTLRQRRSRLAAASLSAEDSVGFAQQPLDLVPDPRERLGSAFEGERLDFVSEKVQPFRDCRAPSLQLGANLLRSGDHALLASTACGSASSSLSCRLGLRSRWTARTAPTPTTAANALRLRRCGRHHGLLPARHLLGNSLRWTTGTAGAPLPARLATTAPTVRRLLPGRDAPEQGLDRGPDLPLHDVADDRYEASLSRQGIALIRRQS